MALLAAVDGLQNGQATTTPCSTHVDIFIGDIRSTCNNGVLTIDNSGCKQASPVEDTTLITAGGQAHDVILQSSITSGQTQKVNCNTVVGAGYVGKLYLKCTRDIFLRHRTRARGRYRCAPS